MKKTQGHVQPKQQGGSMKSQLHGAEVQLAAMVEKYPDATSQNTASIGEKRTVNGLASMCRAPKKAESDPKKNKTQPRRDRKSSEIEMRVLGESQRYRP